MRFILKIKSYLRQSPTLQVVLLSSKFYFYQATGKGWLGNFDAYLPFLALPCSKSHFNRVSAPWSDHPLSFFGQKPEDF